MLDRLQRATPVLLALTAGFCAVSVVLQAVMLTTALRFSEQMDELSNQVNAMPVVTRRKPLPVTIMNQSVRVEQD